MSKKYFICSDVHSFYFELSDALHTKGFDWNNPSHYLIVCGDLFDRGPDTVKCYEFVKGLAEQGRFIYIRGNHEDLLEQCVRQIRKRFEIGRHHISNGTVKTIGHFMNTHEYDILSGVYKNSDFDHRMDEILNFINNISVDYYELGDFIFVHGWIPVVFEEGDEVRVHENWRDGDWKNARWKNGMECWESALTLPGKTIVCGHWHTSWGHHYLRKESPEWGATANFNPFIDKGIIALDGCTAYSHKVNCLVIQQIDDRYILLEE